MGKLSLLWIALGLVILVLGSSAYMDILAKKPIPEPVTMLFFGTCLVGFAKLIFSMKKQ